MRVVSEPANLIEAYLLKGVLESDGIPVFVRGEHLLGGVGQLPAIGLLALCVPDVCAEQANGILAALAAHPPLAVPSAPEMAAPGVVMA
ncbi:MAG: DUF2007 domain-containing protein [Proteobacteria bacterium]|nr:DUF2007 domain-containing protein [Pseudomonadota bacterium]MBS0463887.1 DUF2007 domain-containing protein [Pseudomonadota bacterium]